MSVYPQSPKNAKCLIVVIKEFLCVLCVSAVKMVFMDERELVTGAPNQFAQHAGRKGARRQTERKFETIRLQP